MSHAEYKSLAKKLVREFKRERKSTLIAKEYKRNVATESYCYSRAKVDALMFLACKRIQNKLRVVPSVQKNTKNFARVLQFD